MAKELSTLSWIEDFLPKDFLRKPMFGGFAYYVDQRMVFTHPVLTKWLYLPQQTEDFDTKVEEILKEIRRRSELFGIVPKPRKSKKSKAVSKKSNPINTRKPKMFSS